MTEEGPNQGATGDTAETGAAAWGESPLSAQAAGIVDERPELLVGAAFVGGLALAQILKRVGND